MHKEDHKNFIFSESINKASIKKMKCRIHKYTNLTLPR